MIVAGARDAPGRRASRRRGDDARIVAGARDARVDGSLVGGVSGEDGRPVARRTSRVATTRAPPPMSRTAAAAAAAEKRRSEAAEKRRSEANSTGTTENDSATKPEPILARSESDVRDSGVAPRRVRLGRRARPERRVRRRRRRLFRSRLASRDCRRRRRRARVRAAPPPSAPISCASLEENLKRREAMRVNRLEAVAAAAAEAARAAAAAVEAAAAAAAKAKAAEAAVEAAKAARASTSAAAAAIARAPPSANRAHVYPIAIPVATVERDRAGVSTSGRDVREDQTRRAPAVRDSADEMGDEKDAAGRVPPRRDDATIVDGASASDARIRAGGARMEGGARARVDTNPRAAEVRDADLAKSSKLSAAARGFVPGRKRVP